MKWIELTEIMKTLEKYFTDLNVDYYLIGAMARQYWYDENDIECRMTLDIDYAILIGSEEEYQNVRNCLIKNAGWIPTKTNAFVLITPNKVQVDLLPFGKIQQGDIISIGGQGLTSISMEGMKEVYDAGTRIATTASGTTFKVATLPAIVLLKLIAYSDRPEYRQKDSLDIGHIIMSYFNINDDYIYEKHNDLFTINQTLHQIASTVIGREIALILNGNKELKEKICAQLDQQIDLAENSKFIKTMSTGINQNIESIIELLKKMRWGLDNKSTVE